MRYGVGYAVGGPSWTPRECSWEASPRVRELTAQTNERMTLFQRAATLAATAFCMALTTTGTQGLAAEVDRIDIIPAISVSKLPNVPAQPPVPELSPTLEAETPEPTRATYDTLAEAVAAQPDTHAEDEEALRCLATTIFYESKGESLAGQLAVAEVVINRVKSGRFASDICGVIKQRGQFSFVRRGIIPAVDTSRTAYRRAVAVAKVALADLWDSPAAEALFFNGRRAGLSGLTKVALIGNHIFYR